jgi:intracellular septation protein
MFIMWKPSITFWLMGLVFWGSQAFFQKNLFRSTLGAEVDLPDTVWQRLNFSWVAFFALMGLLNLLVVYSFRDSWVSFHTFGSTGLSFAFVIAQGFYMSRHLDAVPASDKPAR